MNQTTQTATATPMTADPRGPMRKVTAIVERGDGTLIVTDCGHGYDRNQTFTYKVGQQIRCFECGKVARLECDRTTLIAALAELIEQRDAGQDSPYPWNHARATLARVRP